MKILGLIFQIIILANIIACSTQETSKVIQIDSPNKINQIEFELSEDGEPTYRVKHKEKIVIKDSKLGFALQGLSELGKNLIIKNVEIEEISDFWEMPWGETKEKIANNYQELKVELAETTKSKRLLNLYFRAYDDGIAFRYEFPKQNGIDSLTITDELSEFQLTSDHTTWWIPGDWDIYEHLYNTTKVSEIDAKSLIDNNSLAQTYIPENAVNTPVTMKAKEGYYLSFHEANLTDYAGMTLKVDPKTLKLSSNLVGSDRLGYKVKRALPFKTPWRTIQIADKATELIESKLILNLNEPNKLESIEWFQPQKYIGIWWEMHIGKASWDYGMTLDKEGNWLDTGKAHGKHGATTENTKRYIDFAAANGIRGVLVEGWNTGWERWIGFEEREGVFDFVTPYPDYDIEGLTKYAKEKGVEIIMHHETSAAPSTYEQQLDTAFQMMQNLGIHLVKTGYVGKIIPKGEYHHGQWMVNHYRKVLETAAKYQIAINAHEPIKATGFRRTYPNAVSREGLRGQEFNAWAGDGGNPPEHLSIVAFTRMLAGPIDFTPGIFEISLPTKPDNQINTTLAHQLALYVVLYSPIQMACDLPDNYEGQPAFQFIRDVGIDWEETRVLDGEIGDFVCIARRAKQNWFVGAISDENPRKVMVNFDFLDDGATYEVKIYQDAKDAHYRDNPTAIEIKTMDIKKGMSKTFKLAAGGGLAISLIKK